MTAVEMVQKSAAAPREARWRTISRLVFTFPHLLTLAYLIVGGLLVMKHGLWRDEAQAFVIARDAGSFHEFFHVMQYEGHPPLWHILLFLLTRITVAPAAMQWFHLLMAGATVYLVARFSPFTAWIKILFAFGYFQLFEYGIIARNYQIFVLLTVAVLVVWQQGLGKGKRQYLWLGILLFLLCLTHVSGVILAAGLGVMLLLESALSRDGWRAVRRNWLQFMVGIIVAAAGAWLAVRLLTPPPDASFHNTDFFFRWNSLRADFTLGTLWNAYVPIPQWRDMHFWNSNFLGGEGGVSSLFLSARAPSQLFPFGAASTRAMIFIAIAIVLMLFSLSWRAIVLYLVSTGGLLLFSYSRFEGDLRHHGALFIALIAGFWMAWVFQRSDPAALWKRVLRALPRGALTMLLVAHVVAAWVACYYAWHFPFSPARQAATALSKVLTPDDQLMVYQGPEYVSLAAYLPGRKFYLPDENRWGTYAIWQLPTRSAPGGLDGAFQLAQKSKKPVILIASGNLPTPPGVTFLGGYAGSIVGDENYFFYRVSPNAVTRQPTGMQRFLRGVIGG